MILKPVSEVIRPFFWRRFVWLVKPEFFRHQYNIAFRKHQRKLRSIRCWNGAPGFSKGKFTIELNNDLLTISLEKNVEKETKESENFTRREFSYQSFSRSFTLPNTVNSDKIGAKYQNGILKVSIPKKEEAKPKPAKQIQIS